MTALDQLDAECISGAMQPIRGTDAYREHLLHLAIDAIAATGIALERESLGQWCTEPNYAPLQTLLDSEDWPCLMLSELAKTDRAAVVRAWEIASARYWKERE